MLISETWLPALAAILLAGAALASGGQAYAYQNFEGSNTVVINPGSATNITIDKSPFGGNTEQSPTPRFIGDMSVTVHDTLRFKASAADPDGNMLNYALSDHPSGASITDAGRFSWTPDDFQTGSHTFTIIASDGTYSDSKNVTITVSMPRAINQNPVAPDILLNAELYFPSVVTPTMTDPDGDDITITEITGATFGHLDTSRLPRISYTPNQTGIDTIDYTVSDGLGGTANGTVSIFINPPGNSRPVLDRIHNVGARVGVNLNFTASASDTDGASLTFDISNAPDGATMTTGGHFSWTPSESQNGTHTVTIMVHDGRGGADWQHVIITVLRADETNHMPVPENIATTVVLGGGKGFQPDITDPENDETTIVWVSDSSLGDVDDLFLSQGIIVYVAGVLGDDEVNYTVSDGKGGFVNGTISITVVEPTNVRPIIGFVGDKSINANDELAFTIDAIDIDGVVTGFDLQGAPSGAAMTALGDFSWTPTVDDVGGHNFTVIVFDDAGNNSTEEIGVTVRSSDYVNSPPAAPDVVIATSQDIFSIIRPSLADPDEGDSVRISETSQTTKGRILSGLLRAGIIMYQPHQGESGTETVSYTVSDSSDGRDTATITVFISARGNINPILDAIDFRNINAGQPLKFDLMAVDPDNDTISYLLVGAPDDASISRDGRFHWTPKSSDVGNHTFTATAYDDRGGSDSKTAVIRVLPAETANQPPIAPSIDIAVSPGDSIVITPEISDPDGDLVTITDAVTDGTGVVIQLPDSINYVHIATTSTETITYTVTDARGSTATGTIVIQINTPEHEPTLSVHETVISTKSIKPTVISTEVADSNNAFAVDFYQQLASSDNQTGRNIFFSPSSVYNTFSLLYEGAEENTAAQMQDVFGFEPNSTMRHNDTAHTLTSINRYDSDSMLRMANALWMADWFAPYDLYVDTSEIMYLTKIQRANFTDPDDGAKKINEWTSSKTGGKINEIITKDDVNDETSIVLTNAVYFNGTWATEFPQNGTDKYNFWFDDNLSKEIDFMKVETEFNYTEVDGVQVLKLPYKGNRLSMLVILPQDVDRLEVLEKSISSQQIGNWIYSMHDRNVALLMPKFEIKTNYDLKNILAPLGLTDVFDKARANLGGIVDVEPHGGLYMSDAIQSAYVRVDEKGTEKAITANIGSTLPQTPVRFTADHPFIFTIYDEESGIILFMGRISDPTALEY